MERRILESFAARYPASAQRRGGRRLRLRDWPELLPAAFASAESRCSFLEAMERLERSGLVELHWKKRRVGDDLAAVDLADPAELYRRLGLPLPEDEAAALRAAAADAETAALGRGDGKAASRFRIIGERADDLAGKIGPRDVADLAKLAACAPFETERLPLRALSIRLFADSKRLESLAAVFRTMESATKAGGERASAVGPDLFPRRSYPEAAIAGRADLVFRDGAVWTLAGRAVSLSASAVFDLDAVRPRVERVGTGRAASPPRALCVENKETFHAFVRAPGGFDVVTYCGGRPNRAVRTLLRLIALAGFAVYHAGDLDPDGIAILGEVSRLCGARPLGMDTEVFDRYQAYARGLDRTIVARLDNLTPDVLELPGIADLAAAIRARGKGVEQEIIDYAPLVAELD
jgi:hypothetical protein